MLDRTNAFKIQKEEQQRIMDFSKLVCYSIPSLKKAIKGYKKKIPYYDVLAAPDYFVEPVDVDRIGELSKHYKENLSKYILISSFSFFESYFRDVVKELEEFHGGVEQLIDFMRNRHAILLSGYTPIMISQKQLLQTKYKKRKWEKYKKLITSLERDIHYRHPSELFSTIGIKSFFELVSSGNFKSVMIPDLIEIGLGLDLSEKVNKHADLKGKSLRDTFDIMRELRNSIGHGKLNSISFEKVMDLIRFIRYLSVKLDNHLVQHFFVIQKHK